MPTVLPVDAALGPEVALDPRAFPAEIELVPGALRATIHLHRLESQRGEVRCWSYVSAGLAPLGQAEVALTVSLPQGAEPGRFSTDPLRFFVTLHGLAAQGRTVTVGGLTELGGAGFMGCRGLLYARSQALESVPLPPGALAIVGLTADEVAVLKSGGHARVLAALGNAYRYYPHPPWLERGRKSVISPERTRGTLLDQMPRMPVAGTVRMEGNTVRMELRGGAEALITRAMQSLPPDAAFALLTEMDPNADGCLTWEAGQSAPSAITPPGSRAERLAGCFVLFAPEQPTDEARMFEDGYGVLLTRASTRALREALVRAQPLALPAASGSTGFALAWVPTRYENPIDGSVVSAPDGFRTYAPAGGVKPALVPGVELRQIILLTPQDDIAARVSVGDLGDYCKALEAVVGECLAPHARGGTWELLVELTLGAGGGVKVQMATRGAGADPGVLEALQKRLEGAARPAAQGGEVAFQMQFALGAR